MEKIDWSEISDKIVAWEQERWQNLWDLGDALARLGPLTHADVVRFCDGTGGEIATAEVKRIMRTAAIYPESRRHQHISFEVHAIVRDPDALDQVAANGRFVFKEDACALRRYLDKFGKAE